MAETEGGGKDTVRNYFVLDGVDSRTFGVYISGQGTFSSPARPYEARPIPGRQGDILTGGKRLENGVLTYPAFIVRDLESNIRALRNFLLSRSGYVRLTDSYHPEEFQMVYYGESFEPQVTERNSEATFDLVFGCKPQRFLLSGETKTVYTSSGTITNPTRFPARPLIRAYGTGTVGIGSTTITITAADGYTDIDCALMAAYKGSTNKNANIQLSTLDYPVLPPGNSGITMGGGVARVEVTPRWWEV